jgi:CheY-like chemotaxis protein
MPNTRQILIVDDDPELRDALSEQLSLYEEFEAVAAEDGSKSVQAAKAGQIDLVIMDVVDRRAHEGRLGRSQATWCEAWRPRC